MTTITTKTTHSNTSTPDFSDILAAKRRISPHINATQVVQSSLLNDWLGHEIFFKAEPMQKIGAFKARGGCNAVAAIIERAQQAGEPLPTRIVANSSGNHAQAVAWAASVFNIPATIYMASNASPVKVQATRAYGAEVVLCENRKIADAQVAAAAEQPGVVWIPPYNHPDVIAGQGTAVLEAITELGEVDGVCMPVGGGGLMSGSYLAAKGLLPNVAVFGAEPLAGNDAAMSRRAGKIIALDDSPKTMADGAMTLAMGDITFPFVQQLDDLFEIDEPTIRYWTQWLQHLLKLHVEPTSAMTMGAVCEWLKQQSGKKRVVVVLTGGNIDAAMMQRIWSEDCLTRVPGLG